MSDTAPLYAITSCDTVLNEARRLYTAGSFPVFASVIAASQTAGRGQHGHHWVSPVGNLYAAIRLPLTPPFTDFRGPIAVSTVIADVLSDLGYAVRIKWPNDIALETPTPPWAKCAGILLEKKGDLLVAGIGINIVSHPPVSDLREGAALPAGSLTEVKPAPSALTLWKSIARRFAAFDAETFLAKWPASGEKKLLWVGKTIVLTTAADVIRGRFAGLGPSGELRLVTAEGEALHTTGSLRLAAD